MKISCQLDLQVTRGQLLSCSTTSSVSCTVHYLCRCCHQVGPAWVGIVLLPEPTRARDQGTHPPTQSCSIPPHHKGCPLCIAWTCQVFSRAFVTALEAFMVGRSTVLQVVIVHPGTHPESPTFDCVAPSPLVKLIDYMTCFHVVNHATIDWKA